MDKSYTFATYPMDSYERNKAAKRLAHGYTQEEWEDKIVRGERGLGGNSEV